jgi:transglutaminase-like putative cysteine protease
MFKGIERFRGIKQFGQAYGVMLENDSHAPGSVDRVLMQEMVKLCSETSGYLYSAHTPIEVLYERGTRPKLESYVENLTAQAASDEEVVEEISQFTSRLQEKAEQDLDKVRIGGLEEEIIERGSDWCTDLARVGCVLCQIVGLPSRLVTLVDVEKPYSGHVIIEVYRAGVWGAVDSTTNVVYRHASGNPATTWELMNDPKLIGLHWRDESTPYTNIGQFRAAAISNYFVWQWKEYNYTVSGVNGYYRLILEMADKGWPDGLRWLHGEDRATCH